MRRPSPPGSAGSSRSCEGLQHIFPETCTVEVPVAIPSLGRGQAVHRGEGPGDDPPPRRGLHPHASRARESAERRPADPDVRTSRVQGAARLRVLLPRLPREMVEGAEGMPVWVYDAVGRLLTHSSTADNRTSSAHSLGEESGYHCVLTVPVPASGVYLVKVGDAPARRVVVIR